MTSYRLYHFTSALLCALGFFLGAPGALRAQTFLLLSNSTNITNGTNTYTTTYVGSGANDVTLGVFNTNTLLSNGDLFVGFTNTGNSLVISNGGQVANTRNGSIGDGVLAFNNSMLITGTGSLLTNARTVFVGAEGASNNVTISEGGTLASRDSTIGSFDTASNNSVLVTGANSRFTNSGSLFIGLAGAGNSLAISNGGTVASSDAYVGDYSTASGNSVLVTGATSLFTNRRSLVVGFDGADNSLIISNGGRVASSDATVGENSIAFNNTALVTGMGSLWTNSGNLVLGLDGSSNSLTIAAGATLVNADGYIGDGSTASGNTALVTGMGSLWTNSGSLFLGYSATNSSLTVAAGGTVAATSIDLGLFAGSSGTLNIGSFGGSDTAGMINTPSIAFGSGTGVLNFNQSDATTITSVISGAGTVNQLGAGTTTLSGPNTYSGGTLISAGELVGSTTSLQGAITNEAKLNFDQSIDGTYAGVISGTGNVTKNGTGSLTLSGDNSFGGVLTVTEGKLTVDTINNADQDGVLGNSANAVVLGASGGLEGFLRYVGTADSASSTKRFTAATGGTAGLEVSNSTTTLTLSGVIDGGGNVTKGGAGTLALAGDNTFTGALNIHAGTIEIATINNNEANGVLGNNAHAVGLGKSGSANNGTLRYSGASSATSDKAFTLDSNEGGAGIIQIDNSAVDLALSGVISGVGNFTKAGAGTLTLSGNNTFGGVLTVAAGKLTVNTINDASASGTLGNSSHAVVLGSSGQTGFLHYTGGTATSTKAFTAASGGTAGLEVSNAATTLTLSGIIDGSGDVQKGGAGTLLLSGVNTFTGALNVHDGTIEIASINNNGANGVLGDSTHALALGKAGTANTASLLYTGTSASSTKGLTLVSETNAAGVVNVSNAAAALTLSGAVTGGGRFEKAGAGTLILSASNDYTGGTTLSAGVLRLASIDAAGTGTITQLDGESTLEINATGTVANAMDIYKISTLQTVTLSGNKTLNNATFTVAADTTTTESGILSGDGGITKEGTGTLIVTGNNTYTGAVAVNAGLLELNSSVGGAAAATVSVSVAQGAVLLISQSNQVHDSAAVSLSGGTIQRGSGVSEVFGNLNVTSNSFLDFGTGTAGTMSFGTYTESALLTVENFLPGSKLQFATGFNTALLPTGGSLSNDNFSFSNGFSTGTEGGYFTITAIPEPSTYLAAAGLLALFVWPVRRRLIKDAKSILGLRDPARERLEAYRRDA